MKYRVSIFMTCSVETISPAASLEDAARKMQLHNVGFLPVVDDTRKKVIGVITDRDIVLRSVAERIRPEMTRVKEVMTTKPIFCYEDQTLGEASWLMEKNFVHRLIVLNRKDELVGIVSISDFAAKARKEKLSGHLLRNVSAA